MKGIDEKKSFNERKGNHAFWNWYIWEPEDGAEMISAAKLTLLYMYTMCTCLPLTGCCCFFRKEWDAAKAGQCHGRC